MQNDLIDLIKQKVLDADPRAIKQINFAAKLDGSGKSRINFILEYAKETVLYFSQGTGKVLRMQFIKRFNFYRVKWNSTTV